jgi:signal transduction histidine kinase
MSTAPQIDGARAPQGEFLVKAFATFTEAAGSLERSYTQLQAEVLRLRTELYRANEEIGQEREAKRRLQTMADVAALLAHEIRNPLASLELFAQLLASVAMPGDALEWVRHIQAGIRMLGATVNNVLHLQADSGLDLVPLRCDELLPAFVAYLAPVACQNRVQLVLQSESPAVFFQANRHCLQQLFLNLALNAFRAMPHGGELRFHTKVHESVLQIHVSDCGCGISPERLHEIFRSGFSTRGGSAGLGLTVCRKIMEQHAGTIQVMSEPGAGTTFVLTFPLAAGAP